MTLLILSVTCFFLAIYINRRHYHTKYGEPASFWLYFLSALLLFLAIVGWIAKMDKDLSVQSEVRNMFISKGLPIATNIDNLYNVPVIKRKVSIQGYGSFDFYEIILKTPKAQKEKRGTGYDNTESDTQTIKDVQRFALSDVPERKTTNK